MGVGLGGGLEGPFADDACGGAVRLPFRVHPRCRTCVDLEAALPAPFFFFFDAEAFPVRCPSSTNSVEMDTSGGFFFRRAGEVAASALPDCLGSPGGPRAGTAGGVMAGDPGAAPKVERRRFMFCRCFIARWYSVIAPRALSNPSISVPTSAVLTPIVFILRYTGAVHCGGGGGGGGMGYGRGP